MIKFIYKNDIVFRDKNNITYLYNTKTKQLIPINLKQKTNNLLEICAILYRNQILNAFEKKGISLRTNKFYDTVCDVLFEYEEESEEYQLLHKFIVLAADMQLL